MRRVVIFSWLLVLAASVWGGVWAAQRIAAKPQHLPETPPNVASLPPAEEQPLAAGRIVALDEATGRVTIAHRGVGRFYIEPGKTMFVVHDKSLLTGLSPGD